MKMMIRAITVVVGLMATATLFAQVASSGTSSTTYPPTPAVTSSNATVESSVEDELHLLQQAANLGSGSGAGSVLIVPAGEMSIENLTAAAEDMNVMGRILASSLKQAGVAPIGRNVWLGDPFSGGWNGTPTASSSEGLYLQGYGVLFTMKVSFPLSPGPDSNQPQEKPARMGGDTVWEQARQDLYEPQTDRVRRSTTRQEKYSAEQVENLKTALITALKHAANIRGLQPAESVVVTVIGQGGYTNILRMQTIQGTDDVIVIDRANKTTVYRGGLPENIKQSAPTVLTIRAKISDVTAFAKGDLSLDQFRQKVLILSHPYLGERGGPPSWSSVGVPTVTRRPAPASVQATPVPPPQSPAR